MHNPDANNTMNFYTEVFVDNLHKLDKLKSILTEARDKMK